MCLHAFEKPGNRGIRIRTLKAEFKLLPKPLSPSKCKNIVMLYRSTNTRCLGILIYFD